MKKIFMALIAIGTLANAEFTKVGNVVTDSTTGLAWQDDAVGSQISWQDAIDYCEALSLDTYEDWRLPNINELKSIVDQTKNNPAIVDGFVNTQFSLYWSSTTVLGYEDYAWGVYFDDGVNYYDDKSYSNYVRCVRAGQ